MMIIDYLRPKTINEAVELLERKDPRSIPLAGGSVVSKQRGEPVAVVDLQGLGLNSITRVNETIMIGSMASLDDIDNYFGDSHISEAIAIQAAKNSRNNGTLGGLVCMADGRSSVLTLLLAMDATLFWAPKNAEISIGNWLPQRKEWTGGKIITSIAIPSVEIKFGSIGRSPKDQPIFCCGLAKWKSGRLRVAIGGFGNIPVLVFDGNTTDDVQTAVKIALKEADDQWASAEYRMEAGSVLAKRLCTELIGSGN
jgi:CO/xanthine dehydrogenase FAD-binding subunit